MRLSSKPISSPGRADKFPPPLTRFLRSNVGSRSRGRSRSSPMFVRKKNTNAAIETQEPSSPKVTCIGQVRVRRSKQAGAKPGRTSFFTTTKRRFRWIHKALLCNSVRKLKPRSFRPNWRRWFLFLQVGCRRNVGSAKDSARGESKQEEADEDSDHGNEEEEEEEEEEDEEKEKANVLVSSSPPKNALLLMRSRSAPYRASSLANRFWGSPSPIEDAADGKKEKEAVDRVGTDNGEEEEEEEEKPTSGKEVAGRDSVAESRKGSRIEEKLGFSDGFENSSSERSTKTTGTGDVSSKLIGGGSGRPLVLTRSKSEPATRTGTFDPELSLWKNRRFRFSEGCPPHVCD